MTDVWKENATANKHAGSNIGDLVFNTNRFDVFIQNRFDEMGSYMPGWQGHMQRLLPYCSGPDYNKHYNRHNNYVPCYKIVYAIPRNWYCMLDAGIQNSSVIYLLAEHTEGWKPDQVLRSWQQLAKIIEIMTAVGQDYRDHDSSWPRL